jgi:hypothetical protein
MQLLEDVIPLESEQMQSHVGAGIKVEPAREWYGW